MKSSIKKNTIYNMVKTLASIIFPLITFPYISRVLLPDNVGKINFGSSIVSYFSLVATLGITTYAVRECSAAKTDRNALEKIASEIMSINIVTMAISYVGLILCLIFVPMLRDYRMLIAIQSLSIFFTVVGADWLNTSMEDFQYITIRTVAFQVVALVLMFLFVKEPDDYIIYAIISLVASSAGNFCNVFYRRKYGKICFVWKMNWKEHFSSIMGLFVLLLSQTILNSMDITMLGLMKGDFEVGIYSTAYKLVNVVNQIVASIAFVLMPQLSRAIHDNDIKRTNHLLHNAAVLSATIGIPCFAGLNLLAEEVIDIVGGVEYVSAVVPLRILSVTLLLGCVAGLYGNMYLLPSKKEKKYTIACGLAMVINLIGNALLIPLLSVEGASVVTVISGIIICIVVYICSRKYVIIGNVPRILIAPIVGSASFYVAGYFLKKVLTNLYVRTIVVILISVCIYALVLILLKHEAVRYVFNSLKAKFVKQKK